MSNDEYLETERFLVSESAYFRCRRSVTVIAASWRLLGPCNSLIMLGMAAVCVTVSPLWRQLTELLLTHSHPIRGHLGCARQGHGCFAELISCRPGQGRAGGFGSPA